jgi:hypothetical protein
MRGEYSIPKRRSQLGAQWWHRLSMVEMPEFDRSGWRRCGSQLEDCVVSVTSTHTTITPRMAWSRKFESRAVRYWILGSKVLVLRTGFEPATFAVRGRCPKPLDDRSAS